jgi:glycerol kinase
MSTIISVDSGTSSVRSIAFDISTAQILDSSQLPISLSYPSDGFVEQDPSEIWNNQKQTLDKVITNLSNPPIAIGVTNQRETIVLWNKDTGRPVHNAIVWQDRRTALFCKELQEKNFADQISQITGLQIDPYFSATKLKWLFDNVPEVKKLSDDKKLLCGTIDTWLIWNMTNGNSHVTDPSNASRTMLYNINTNDWDDELLGIFGIPKEILPKVVASSQIVGKYKNIPIASIIGDQQAALYGQNCFELGQAKCTFGTGCFLLVNTSISSVRSKNKLLTSVAWQIDEKVTYALEGSIFMGGAIIQWLRDNLNIIAKSSEIKTLASSVSDSAGIIMVPAFTGLGAPYWDPNAKAAIIGMDRNTNKAHIARASLEAIAHQIADITETINRDLSDANLPRITSLKVDGGASVDDLLMQIVSDYSGLEIIRTNITESTAYGAALLAANAVGVKSSFANNSVETVFIPKISAEELSQKRSKWSRAIELVRGF